MKKVVITSGIILSLAFFNTACSETFKGIKSDSKGAWKKTKSKIHEVTKD